MVHMVGLKSTLSMLYWNVKDSQDFTMGWLRRSVVENKKPTKLQMDISRGLVVSLSDLGRRVYWNTQNSVYYDNV